MPGITIGMRMIGNTTPFIRKRWRRPRLVSSASAVAIKALTTPISTLFVIAATSSPPASTLLYHLVVNPMNGKPMAGESLNDSTISTRIGT